MKDRYVVPAWALPEVEYKPCQMCGGLTPYDICDECDAYCEAFK